MFDSSANGVDRGATAIEYALGVGLFVIALIGSIQFLQDSASDELGARATNVGVPGDAGGTPTTLPVTSTTATTLPGSTSTSSTSSTSSSTTSTTAPGTAAMSGPTSCVMLSGNLQCNFSITGAPQGTSYDWVVWADGKAASNGDAVPPSSTGTAASLLIDFKKAGSFEVRATVTATSQQLISSFVVTCSGNGIGQVCSAT